jgi:pimeloyl-ACP methyl ester carboxylesterase
MKSNLLNFIGGIPDLLFLRIPSFLLEKNPASSQDYLDALRFYSSRWSPGRGESFLQLPSLAPAAQVIEARPFHEGVVELYGYPSGYQVQNPALRETFSSYSANLNCYLHLWRHEPIGSRPLVLCLHGFMMHGPWRARRMFKIDSLFARGLDAALFHQPHHWRRAERRGRQHLLCPQDAPLTLETFGQNLHDLHAAVLLLKNLGYSKLGLIGASLGGYTSALYATFAAPVNFMFLAVPAVDFYPFLKPRPDLFNFKIDQVLLAETRKALDLITPLRYPPQFDVSKICVVAHAGDRLCDARLTRPWIEQWKISHSTEATGGHWLQFSGDLRGRTWYRWLEEMEFI